MDRRCATRALKNARGLQVVAPDILSDSPLFNGTVYFVQIRFDVGSPARSILMSDADMNTAIQYAKLAIGPISSYASQYGPNSLAVADQFLRYEVPLQAPTYDDAAVIEWVNEIAKANGLSEDSCLVVMNPLELTNRQMPRDKSGGYHNKANVPYCGVNMYGKNVTIQDRERAYATPLSHEIAEMTVDPASNFSNPEVCDPCSGDDATAAWVNVFGGTNNTYLQTTRDVALPPDFRFYIAAIVKPSFVQPDPAHPQPAPDSDCTYGPPPSIGG
jgi:hypothetical protein